MQMQLSSTLNEKWKLFAILTIFCCLIIPLYFLTQNLSFSTASKAINQFTPLQVSEPPTPIYIASPPPLSFAVSPSLIKNYATNSTLGLEENKKLILPPIENLAKLNFSMQKLKKPTMKKNINVSKRCDMFDGKWVYNAHQKPSYDSIRCPFIEEKMSCRKNGRPDFDYEKWRWEAKDCHIPLFNGRDMLERLRNKRVIIVGDSLNRNMWESLACLLYTSIKPSRAEVHAKYRDYKVLKAKDYNAIIEFHWSPFLVEFDENHKSGKKLLMVDKISPNSKLWRGADIMVFNSGHWWTHRGKFKRWDLFQYKGQAVEKMPVLEAYDIGMKTWEKWVKNNVDFKKTMVFFRSISTTHNVGKQWCYNSTQPMVDESYQNHFPRSMLNIIEGVIKETSIKYLNITKLSKYRRDAHPSVYRTSNWRIYTSRYKRLIPSHADCSHWCLPGLPDTWNRLLYASMFVT